MGVVNLRGRRGEDKHERIIGAGRWRLVLGEEGEHGRRNVHGVEGLGTARHDEATGRKVEQDGEGEDVEFGAWGLQAKVLKVRESGAK